MYDNSMIVPEECKNIRQDGKITGFQIGVRIPYYRGIVLSLLGDTKLSVDGQLIPREKITLTVTGGSLPLVGVDDEPVIKWEFGEVGILSILQPDGLPAGEHRLELFQHVRTPYIPGGVAGEDTKIVHFS